MAADFSAPTAPHLDVAELRSRFSALDSGIAFFDGPGGTQTPDVVAEAIAGTLTGSLSNRGSLVASQRHAENAVDAFRHAYADLLGADPRGIVFGRSATQLTYDFSRHLSRDWKPGDEIVVCALDHDANVRPWVQAAERTGATLRWIEFDPGTGEVRPEDVSAVLSDRTALVAVTAASNLIGTKPPISEIAELVHRSGALLYVDGVHYAAHALVDVAAMGADFFVCSPYKFFGPHCAVLAADPALLETIRPDKLAPSSDQVPERFEFGTLPYEILAGATAAVDFIADIPRVSDSAAIAAIAGTPAVSTRREALIAAHTAIEGHERTLLSSIEAGLADLPADVISYSRAAERTPTLLIAAPGRSMADASVALAGRDVLAPAGTFYAVEPARRLDLVDPAPMRIGVAAYTDENDVDRLLSGLADFLQPA